MFLFFLLYTDLDYYSGDNVFTLKPGKYTVHCYGGKGGDGYNNGKIISYGGYGAHVYGTLTITGTSKTFYAVVGGRGTTGTRGPNGGGYNGGGSSGKDEGIIGTNNDGSGGGGGASDVRIGINDKRHRIIVAGGGSGAVKHCNGAPGGDLTGYYAFADNKYSPANDNYRNGTQRCTQYEGDANGNGGNGKSDVSTPGGGGGGGWRGGPTSGDYSFKDDTGYKGVATSGSSYIAGYPGCPANSYYRFTSPWGMEKGVHSGIGRVLIHFEYVCSDNCESCINATYCTTCSSGYYRYNGFCQTWCPNGTIGISGVCEPCTFPCATCSGSVSACTTCKSGYYLYQGFCQARCPNGTIGISGVCEPCTSPCATCSGSVSACTTCKSGYYMSENICKQCKSPCLNCEGSEDFCITCQENFFFYANKCYSQCSELNDPSTSKYFGNDEMDKSCKKCSDNCISCDENYTICKECKSMYYLENGKCIPNPTTVFTNSYQFTLSNLFSFTEWFTNSYYFSKTNVFSNSPPFTQSKSFSDSNLFTHSSRFSSSKDFSLSSRFSSSFIFSVSSKFTSSVFFSKSRSFSDTKVFIHSIAVTTSFVITETKLFSSSYFSEIGFSSLYNSLTQNDDFSKIVSLSKSSMISKTFASSQSFEFSTQENQFYGSNQFSKSSIISKEELQSKSVDFTKLSYFSKPADLSQIDQFSNSMASFNIDIDFKSSSFSENKHHSQTFDFIKPSDSSDSSDFSDSFDSTQTNHFIESNPLSKLSSVDFSKYYYSSSTIDIKHESDDFSQLNQFSDSRSFTIHAQSSGLQSNDLEKDHSSAIGTKYEQSYETANANSQTNSNSMEALSCCQSSNIESEADETTNYDELLKSKTSKITNPNSFSMTQLKGPISGISTKSTKNKILLIIGLIILIVLLITLIFLIIVYYRMKTEYEK